MLPFLYVFTCFYVFLIARVHLWPCRGDEGSMKMTEESDVKTVDVGFAMPCTPNKGPAGAESVSFFGAKPPVHYRFHLGPFARKIGI